MSILCAVVRARPLHLSALCERLGGMAGVEVALNPGDGRLVLVLEDAPADSAAPALASAAATLTQIARWPELLDTSLVYEYSGPDAPAPAAAAQGDYRSWRTSLDELARSTAA